METANRKDPEIIERLDRIEKTLNGIKEKPLNLEEAAKYLDISKSHLYKLTSKGRIPHYKPEGKKVYFDKTELDQWLLRNRVSSNESISRNAESALIEGSFGTSQPYATGRLGSRSGRKSR